MFVVNILSFDLQNRNYEVSSIGQRAMPDRHGKGLEISYRILFVDDDTELLKMLESYFAIKGYTVMTGGDDYILEPFSLKELEARINAHLKREERHKTKSEYRFKDGLMIDYTKKALQINGNPIELTKTEYDIVEYLSMNTGQVFDKERIYEKVCGYDAEGDSRVITELVRRIRNKLTVCTNHEYIETVWGTGYRWKK